MFTLSRTGVDEKDRGIGSYWIKLFANFCHHAGHTKSPLRTQWPKTWMIPLPALLQQRPMPWMTRWHLKGRCWKAYERPSQISYDFMRSENQDASRCQSWRCVPSQASWVPVPVCTMQKEVAQVEKSKRCQWCQIWMMLLVLVSFSYMLLHDSEDLHRACLNMVWTSRGARSVESTVEALCPGSATHTNARPRSCVRLLI